MTAHEVKQADREAAEALLSDLTFCTCDICTEKASAAFAKHRLKGNINEK